MISCSCKAEDIFAKCKECDDFLCIMCFNVHSTLKITKDHTVSLLKPTKSSGKKPKLKMRSVGVSAWPKTKNKGVQCKPALKQVTQIPLSNNKKCKQFHGISLALWNQIFNGIKGKFVRSHKLAPEDQLSVFYHKLKAGFDFTELSTIYGVQERLISKVFGRLVDVVYQFTSKYIWWLTKG